MFLSLLKRAVKGALHDAVEQWALECGLPRKMVEELRARRVTILDQADDRAALALGVEDDMEQRPALPMPSAAHITTDDNDDKCPPPGDELALLHRVHRRREHQVGWADIAEIASNAGHDASEDALRMRYRRWREKTDASNGDQPPTA